jgi:hypothetical protein
VIECALEARTDYIVTGTTSARMKLFSTLYVMATHLLPVFGPLISWLLQIRMFPVGAIETTGVGETPVAPTTLGGGIELAGDPECYIIAGSKREVGQDYRPS